MNESERIEKARTAWQEKENKIQEARQYNLKLLAEQEAKREYWNRVNECRIYNLALKQKQETERVYTMQELQEQGLKISTMMNYINLLSTV